MRTLTSPTMSSGRRTACLLALAAALLAPLAAGVQAAGAGIHTKAAVPDSLLQAAKANQKGVFDVLVTGDGSDKSGKLADKLAKMLGRGDDRTALAGDLKAQFASVSGVDVKLLGKDVLKLAKQQGLLSIIPNASVEMQGLSNPQKWDDSVGAKWFWSSPQAKTQAATIAIVDSGVDNSTGQFGNRLLTQVDLGGGSTSGDPRGHGTFVAAVAAGSGAYAGVAPTANLVSIDVFDALGHAQSSDVLRAMDWILQHKDEYGIRVVNLSLLSANLSSFFLDPLDQAVERLWQSGIVVVCAAGNYARYGKPSGVWFPPGNDPFVITVGAADIHGSNDPKDDFNAPWTSYGYTPDGFAKPELGAPGRYLIEQIPVNASIIAEHPANLLKPGLLQLSGTSFSAPIVSGMAADLLGLHPGWTADQVKGVLMASAIVTRAAPNSLGVGEANLQKAMSLISTPNPNAALDQFLVADPAGGSVPVFDSSTWMATAQSNPAWNTASWNSASWASASWSSASWASASWASASWASASWSTASWNSASWASASWSNNATADGRGDG